MLDKNLAVTLNVIDISQPFECLSILLPNNTINFLLFKLMSRLLIDELSSLLSAFSLLDGFSAFFFIWVQIVLDLLSVSLSLCLSVSLCVSVSLSVSVSVSVSLSLSLSVSLSLSLCIFFRRFY